MEGPVSYKGPYYVRLAVADPDFELRKGAGFILLAQPAFLPSVISSFFTQNKGGGRSALGPLVI